MANALGDFDTSAVIYGKFVTVRVDTGAPATLGGTPALSVYKDNSTTQSTTGVTLTADFDSVTGLNHFAIDTSADGTFYSAGSFFDIVITTGTVNSVSAVGYCVGQFTIRKNSALKPATAGRTLVVDASGLADANAVKLGPSGSGTTQTARDIGASVLLSAGTGTGQLDFTSGVVKANLAQILGTALTETAGQIAAAFKQFFDVASPTGTMKAITNVVTTTTATNVTTVNGLAAGVITSSSFTAGAIDAAAIAADAIGASELAASAVTEIQAGLSTLDAAGVRSAVGLASANLDTQIATLATSSTATAIKAKTDSLTFTVAGQVDANIQSVNDVTVTGTGAAGDEWGP